MATYKIKNIFGSTVSWRLIAILPGESLELTFENQADGTANLPTFTDYSDVTTICQNDEIILLINDVQQTKDVSLSFITDIYDSGDEVLDVFGVEPEDTNFPFLLNQVLEFKAQWDLIPTIDALTGLPSGEALFAGDDASLHPIDKNGLDLKLGMRAWRNSLTYPVVGMEYVIDGITYTNTITSMTDSMDLAPSNSNPRLWVKGTNANTGPAEVTTGVISFPSLDTYLVDNGYATPVITNIPIIEGQGVLADDTLTYRPTFLEHANWTDGWVAMPNDYPANITIFESEYSVSSSGVITFQGNSYLTAQLNNGSSIDAFTMPFKPTQDTDIVLEFSTYGSGVYMVDASISSVDGKVTIDNTSGVNIPINTNISLMKVSFQTQV